MTRRLILALVVAVAAAALVAGYVFLTRESDAPLRAQHPVWGECEDVRGVQCATVKVPLDHARPGGATVDLVLGRLLAWDPERRAGSLVVHFGGPGGSGVEALAGRSKLFDKLRTRYDIVAFDQRGFGRSTPFSCQGQGAPVPLADVDHTPDDDRERASLAAAHAEYAALCGRSSGGLLPHMGTVSTAHDLDVLRSVLGEERLDYLGLSYGGAIGEAYLRLHSGRVGRMVLDAPVFNHSAWLEPSLIREEVADLHAGLKAFAEDCALDEDCPVGRDPRKGLRTIERLLTRMEREPLDAAGQALTDGVAAAGLAAHLYDGDWEPLREALRKTLRGDGRPLRQAVRDSYADAEADARTATACADNSGRAAIEELVRTEPGNVDESPVFGRWYTWTMLACHGWPKQPDPPWLYEPAGPAAPVMVVGATGDQLSSRTARYLGVHLPGARLVTVPGEEHTVYRGGNACADAAVEGYLLGGKLPTTGTTC